MECQQGFISFSPSPSHHYFVNRYHIVVVDSSSESQKAVLEEVYKKPGERQQQLRAPFGEMAGEYVENEL